MTLSDWELLEALIRAALEEIPPERQNHEIADALRLSGAFAAATQKHMRSHSG